jgi:hypothetical protein
LSDFTGYFSGTGTAGCTGDEIVTTGILFFGRFTKFFFLVLATEVVYYCSLLFRPSHVPDPDSYLASYATTFH